MHRSDPPNQPNDSVTSRPTNPAISEEVKNATITNPNPSNQTFVTEESKKPVIVQVLPVTLYGPVGSVQTYAMLDLGSTCSLLSDTVAQELGLEGETQSLNLSGIRECSLLSSQRVCLKISGSDETRVIHEVNGVWVVDRLNLPVVNVDMTKEKSKWSHLKELDLPSVKGKQVTLLLGSDAIDLIKPLEVRTGPPGAPHALNTALGWTTVGPVPGVAGLSENVFHVEVKSEDDELSDLSETGGLQSPLAAVMT
jgi:hypothetical protein